MGVGGHTLIGFWPYNILPCPDAGTPSALAEPLSCRESKEKLSKACAAEVFKVQRAVAVDYRADPAMAAACKADAERLCKDVKDGGGRKTACLVGHVDIHSNCSCCVKQAGQAADAGVVSHCGCPVDVAE